MCVLIDVQLLRIDAEASSDPYVSFNAQSGVTAVLSYRMSIFVDNATLGTPHIATLAVNLTIVAVVEVGGGVHACGLCTACTSCLLNTVPHESEMYLVSPTRYHSKRASQSLFLGRGNRCLGSQEGSAQGAPHPPDKAHHQIPQRGLANHEVAVTSIPYSRSPLVFVM